MSVPAKVEGRLPTPGPDAPRRRRVDASMSLLTEAANSPLDAGYAEAAARRAHPHAADRRRPAGVLVVALVAVMLGAGTVWAARALRAPAPDVLQARTVLETEIADRTASATANAEENAALRAEVESLSASALEGSGSAVIEDLAALSAISGTTAVRGPGLTVTLSDSPRAASGAADAADERVQDIDLQILSNGLWAAGAEAIAINGHRLTALSAIRSAGEAILVDLAPLIGPYRVEAIGDPQAMQVALARTPAARHLTLLRDTYGIGAQTALADELELPGSSVPTLRHSAPIPEPTPVDGSDVATGPPPVPGSGEDLGET